MPVLLWARQIIPFGRYLIVRMNSDRVKVNAGYLSYITLLSLVPMLTVLFSMLSSFALFDDVSELVQEFVIDNFVPAAGDMVSQALTQFIGNTGKMSAIGGVFLFVTALTLISNIDNNLNYIWRVNQKRRRVFSFSMYWMILTLGPILVGASIAVSSYLMSLKLLDNEMLSGVFNWLLRRLPFLLSFFAFTGLYLLVPNKKVRLTHAIVGGALAAVLFELSKKGFSLYITQFPSYQLIYGALAAIPILFFWVYLSWLIVLVGAEVTASLGEREQWQDLSIALRDPSTALMPQLLTSPTKEEQESHSSEEKTSDSSDPKSD